MTHAQAASRLITRILAKELSPPQRLEAYRWMASRYPARGWEAAVASEAIAQAGPNDRAATVGDVMAVWPGARLLSDTGHE